MVSEVEIVAVVAALRNEFVITFAERSDNFMRQVATVAMDTAERVRAAEMEKLEKSLTSLIREDRPE